MHVNSFALCSAKARYNSPRQTKQDAISVSIEAYIKNQTAEAPGGRIATIVTIVGRVISSEPQ
jgi:hypothetical protein